MHLPASLTQNLLSAFDFVGSQIATDLQHSRPSLDGAPSDQADAFDLLLKDALDATAPVIVPDAGVALNPAPKPAAVDAAIRQRVLGTGEWPPATTSPIAARDVATQQAPLLPSAAGPSPDDNSAGDEGPVILQLSRTSVAESAAQRIDSNVFGSESNDTARSDAARSLPVTSATDVETASAQRASGVEDEPEAVILPFAPVSHSQLAAATSSARTNEGQPVDSSRAATVSMKSPASSAAAPITAANRDTAQTTTEFASGSPVEFSEIDAEQSDPSEVADAGVTSEAQRAVPTEDVTVVSQSTADAAVFVEAPAAVLVTTSSSAATSSSAKPAEPLVEDREESSAIGRSEGEVSEHRSLRSDASHVPIDESAAGTESQLAADDHASAGHLPSRRTAEAASKASDRIAGTAESGPVVTTFTMPANRASASDARPTAEPSLVQQLNPGVETWRDALQEQGTARFAAWLSPPDVGHVWVELTRSAEGITARLKASDDSVQSLLETQEPELRQALDNSGISVTELDLSGRATGDSASQDHRPPPEQHEEQEFAGPRVSERTPQRSVTQRSSAVDVRV